MLQILLTGNALFLSHYPNISSTSFESIGLISTWLYLFCRSLIFFDLNLWLFVLNYKSSLNILVYYLLGFPISDCCFNEYSSWAVCASSW